MFGGSVGRGRLGLDGGRAQPRPDHRDGRHRLRPQLAHLGSPVAVSHRGRRPPGRRRVALGCVLAATLVGVARRVRRAGRAPEATPGHRAARRSGGTVTVGIDQAPTGCNPNTATGDTFADRSGARAGAAERLHRRRAGPVPVRPGPHRAGRDGAVDQSPRPSSTPSTRRRCGRTGPRSPRPTSSTPGSTSVSVPIDGTRRGRGRGQHRRLRRHLDDDPVQPRPDPDRGVLDPVRRLAGAVLATWSRPTSSQQAGWSPGCTTVDPAVDLSGRALRDPVGLPASVVTLVRNPRWWGQPPKVARIVIRVAERAAASWPSGCYGHDRHRRPDLLRPRLPEDVSADAATVKSAVDISNTFLELEFSTVGAPTADPLVRQGIAYAIDRQELSDKVAGWADVAIAALGQPPLLPGAGRLPQHPGAGPGQLDDHDHDDHAPGAAAVIGARLPDRRGPGPSSREPRGGRLRPQRRPGTWVDTAGRPLTLRLAVDDGDGWAAAGRHVLVDQLQEPGDRRRAPRARSPTPPGRTSPAGRADLAVAPARTPAPIPTRVGAWYTPTARSARRHRSPGLERVCSRSRSTASSPRRPQQLDPVTAQPLYSQIDQQLWADMVALPLFAEPIGVGLVGLRDRDHPWDLWAGAVLDACSTGLGSSHEPATYTGTPTAPDRGASAQAMGHEGPGLQSSDGSRSVEPYESSEWRNRQTRQLEGLVPARAWGFKSPLRHQ